MAASVLNNTTTSTPLTSSMPPTYSPSILDTFIPGYSIFSNLLYDFIGVDSSRFVPVLVIVFGIAAAFSFLYRQIATDISDVLELLTSNIVIENKEAIYDDFGHWIAGKEVSELARTIRVLSPSKSNELGPQDHLEQQSVKSKGEATASEKEGKGSKIPSIFNFSKAEASKALRFEPYFGRYFFWHRGNFFILEKFEKSRLYDSHRSGPADREFIKLSCLGFSTAPIRRLIEEARSDNFENRLKTTRVFRPNAEYRRRYGDIEDKWRLVAHRPCRPIETINLDEAEKTHIVHDFNNFLQPHQANWYATKGIPYRRGYLFHGPPGTGKTSLSYALAGLFGVNIYGASLQDPDLNEEDLCELLNALPNRCIVLLEDIDAAGLRRDLKDKADKAARKKEKRHPLRAWREDPKISLSGLLNAIDGVAAHEGHLLIMTSNAPEKLDDALKRPGRVDLQVEFTLASKVQVHAIFKRMYMTEVAIPHPTDISAEKGAPGAVVPGAFASDDELEAAAEKFTAFFEDFQFSPAEVQGFLLFHKTTPLVAVEKAPEWIKTTLEAKAAEKKLREEQEAEDDKDDDEEDDKKKKKQKEQVAETASEEVSKAFAELLRKLAGNTDATDSDEKKTDDDDDDKKKDDDKKEDENKEEANGETATEPLTNGVHVDDKPIEPVPVKKVEVLTNGINGTHTEA